MAERWVPTDEVAAVAAWRANQGRFEFLREPFTAELTAAQSEARHSTARAEAAEERIAALEAVIRHNDVIFLPRINRQLRRKDERIARAERIARRTVWGAMAFGCAYLIPTALVWSDATGLPAPAAGVGLVGFVGLAIALKGWR